MDGGNIDTTGASVADQLDVDAGDTDTGTTERDFDAEARAHGWTPKDDFRGDRPSGSTPRRSSSAPTRSCRS
jgi:hypothetical protein